MAKREVIEDPVNAARYLQTGVPRFGRDCLHTGRICRAMEVLLTKRENTTEQGDRQRSLLDFFAGNLRSRPRSSPPKTPRPGTSTSLTDEEGSSDEEEVEFLRYIPPPSQNLTRVKRASNGSPEMAPPSKKAKGPFRPSPLHLEGAVIIKRENRVQGPCNLLDFVAAEAEWLTEQEVADHFPEACKVYLADLTAGDQETLTEVLRSAGPISALE